MELRYSCTSDRNGVKKCMIRFPEGNVSPSFRLHGLDVQAVADRLGARPLLDSALYP